MEHAGYWAWIPPVAGLLGAVLGTLVYQLMVGNHLIQDVDYYSYDPEPSHELPDKCNGKSVDLKEYKSSQTLDTIKTVSTMVDNSS
ncbi:Aquaporin-3 [Mactra antiquata]